MNYIIFDLEWNNAYSYVSKGFMNEIIEIGAVKLNEGFVCCDNAAIEGILINQRRQMAFTDAAFSGQEDR